jgi:hypothetical protein
MGLLKRAVADAATTSAATRDERSEQPGFDGSRARRSALRAMSMT